MFMKFSVLPFSLLLLAVTPCFAETVQVRTSEPSSQYLGVKIDLEGRNFVDSFPVAPDKSIFIYDKLTDIRIKKDKVDGLNKFYGLIGYSLHSSNAKPSDTRYLYLQCPVTRETYIDRSPPPKKEMLNGKMSLVYPIKHDVVNKEFLSLGHYSFLSSSDEVVPQLSKNFPMAGKFGLRTPIDLFHLDLMCAQIEGAYAEYRWSETFRDVTLKKFGISE
jgi:hypothetical protein